MRAKNHKKRVVRPKICVSDRLYINDREGSHRWGPSRAWFQRKRWEGNGPPYIKVGNLCFYHLQSGDAYFAGLRIGSTSEKP
jgi:hypothetical protein